MGQTQGGVRVRTLWLGKAILLLVGARDATGFAEIGFCLNQRRDGIGGLEPAAQWDRRNSGRKKTCWELAWQMPETLGKELGCRKRVAPDGPSREADPGGGAEYGAPTPIGDDDQISDDHWRHRRATPMGSARRTWRKAGPTPTTDSHG